MNTILIDVAKQLLQLRNADNALLAEYPISSALKGVGEKQGSYQTPRGRHVIGEKIGENMPIFTVFSARKPTGEIFSEALSSQYPDRDWILSRILWLEGVEEGVNRGNDVDSRSRYIYIHGTNEENYIGVPRSHGCIRMRNADVIDLFDRVSVGDAVFVCA
jgi:L,D-transpeptidase YbiS